MNYWFLRIDLLPKANYWLLERIPTWLGGKSNRILPCLVVIFCVSCVAGLVGKGARALARGEPFVGVENRKRKGRVLRGWERIIVEEKKGVTLLAAGGEGAVGGVNRAPCCMLGRRL